MLLQTVHRYLGDGKQLICNEEFRPDVFRTCVSRVGIIVFGKLDPFTLVEWLIWRWEGAKHGDWLLSSPYFRRGVMRGCVESADLGHVLLEIFPLLYTIRLFVRNTCRVDLNDRTMESLGKDSVFHCDSLMSVRLELLMMVYNDYCISFET